MEKRVSCRAIIIEEGQIVLMYREKNDRIYYTFPGGGIEENETLKECVLREVKEEFGIDVIVQKEVYTYEDETTLQHFFMCKWESGELGSGKGEEFQGNNKGIYIPVLANIDDLNKLPVMPPEITSQLINDVKKYGVNLNEKITNFYKGQKME